VKNVGSRYQHKKPAVQTPAKTEEWIALLKVNCIEGNEHAHSFKLYGMMVEASKAQAPSPKGGRERLSSDCGKGNIDLMRSRT
jgi:hypothetical protein